MAQSLSPPGPAGRGVRWNVDDYPFWRDHFSPEERTRMLADDLRASKTVSIELFALIVLGLALGLAGVLLAI
jgi:hypothetical protein